MLTVFKIPRTVPPVGSKYTDCHNFQALRKEVNITFLLDATFDFLITRLQIQPALQISRLSTFKSDFWPLATFGELKSSPATNS